MSKRRKLAPKVADPAQAPGAAPEPGRGAGGGFWGGSAMNLLQGRLDAASGSLSERILQGLLVVELDPGQIEDARGSDRRDDWKSDGALEALVRDIERRGQGQPIRVRPRDPDWSPSPDDPLDLRGVPFVVQSGRRRLESCRRLGIPVRAIVRTERGDALRADLEERFLENTMRRDLSPFEELLSIGLIAQARQGEEQKAVAADLHVSASDVSLGLACLDLHDELVKAHDVNALAKRDFRQAIPALRRALKGDGAGAGTGDGAERKDATPERKPSPAKGRTIERGAGGLKATATRSPNGVAIRIVGWDGSDERLVEQLDRLLGALSDPSDRS